MFIVGKFCRMEISIVELQHVLEVYPSSPLPLFLLILKKVKVLIKVQNFDINKRREMGMVIKKSLVAIKYEKEGIVKRLKINCIVLKRWVEEDRENRKLQRRVNEFACTST